MAVGVPQLVTASFSFLPLWSHCLPLSYLCVYSIKICVISLRAYVDNPGFSLHLKIINLITSAKTLFTNKVTFTGSQDLTWISSWEAFSVYHRG